MPRPPFRTFARLSLGLLLSCWAFAALAQARAWLDRDHIALGETATLNIQADQASDAPDYSPLLADFTLSGNTSSRQFEWVNGTASTRMLFAVALRPRRDGTISIPPLRIGNQQTQALTLTVSPRTATPANDGAVFIETAVDADAPYVQQAVGVTVRLYSATPLVSGQLDLDAPPGASLQRIGDDTQYERDVGNRSYRVIERHYLLIPERSGAMTIPGAHFQGSAAGGFFDDFFGGGADGGDVDVASAPHTIRVRPVPAGAPQPWLPLRALELRYASTPQRARVGEAASVGIEATADGATATQLPELKLQVDAGAQVFADPPQSDDRFVDGRPQVRQVRTFSIVPAGAGMLRVHGPQVTWWDVQAGIRRTTSLPDLVLQVAPGAAGAARAPAAGSPPPAAGDDGGSATSDPTRAPRGDVWAVAAVAFAALWLLTLAWALQRRGNDRVDVSAVAQPPSDAMRQATQADLARALDRGTLGEVAEVLCAMARPPAADLDALRSRLNDPRQAAAIAALQQARWGGGDGVAARRLLRDAFRGGPRWRDAGNANAAGEPPLPPLYPS